MGKVISTQTNFTSGELSPRAMGRFDLAKYNNGAATLENFLINQLGGAFFRPGTRFVVETKVSAQASRLLSFQYSTQQYYIIEAGVQYMRFYASGGALTLSSNVVLDYMEYASDAAAQSAYVSSSGGSYGANFLTGGTASADSSWDNDPVNWGASLSVDGNTVTRWNSDGVTSPHWWKYDLGSGVTKTVKRLKIWKIMWTTADLKGSNNDSDWTTIQALSTTAGDDGAYKTIDITNSTAYRYYKLDITGYHSGNVQAAIAEIEMYEEVSTIFTCYSEATIKNQGTYSLKCIAAETDSLNETLTRTISSPVDLSNIDTLKFDIYAGRTGSNIKIGIHDTGGTTSEKTYAVSSANTWETVTWDISAVANSDKDAIDSIIITVVNADSANTFYIDNFYPVVIEISTPYLETELFDLQYAQDADTMYIVHSAHAPYKLQRTSATAFSLTAVTLVRPPFLDDNTTAVTITPSAATGTGITLTASSATFLATNVGGWYKVNSAVVKITAFTSTTVVTGDVQAEPDGSAGNIGGTSAYTAWAESAWSDRRGWPQAVTFHEQRLYYANTTTEPQKFWGSALNAYDCFDPGSAADDDAVSFEIATEQVNAIKWLSSSNKQLDIGTAGGTFPANGGASSIITPTDITVSRSTTYGVAKIIPARMSSYLYYIQRNLNQVRELSYDLNLDAQKANDMCILADHILKDGNGAVEMAHQQTPNDRLWIVRNDGQIAVLTRNVDQEVMGWARLIAGSTANGDGVFESVAIMQQDSGDDQIWVIVNRNINGTTKRFVEYFTPESFIDDWDAINLDSSLTLDNPKTITAATKANPIVITCASHGFSNADQIRIDGIVGMEELNGNEYLVANVAANTFELQDLTATDVDGTAYGTYISGGEARKMVTAISGLDHLEGETVSVTIDSNLPTTKTYVVSSGAITLSEKAAVVHAGLPYVGDIKMLKLGDGNAMGSGQDSMRRVYQTTLRVDRSLGTKIGIDEDNLSEVFDATETELYTGDVTPLPATWWEKGSQVLIRQNVALPLNLLCVILHSEVSEV